MITPDNKNEEKSLPQLQAPEKSSTQEVAISYCLLNKAENILESVLNDYGNNVNIIFGRPLSQQEITKKYHNWAERNNLLKSELKNKKQPKISVLSCLPELKFSTEIICSAKLVTNGPQRKFNKPENRSYRLIVRENIEGVEDNLFVRNNSFDGLLDHELGTHFFRMLNEGLQPWYSDRKKFNLSESRSYNMLKAEEGLAAIHTVLKMPIDQLWFPSILYITGAYFQRSNYDTFATVNKISKYCNNREFCYRLVKRAQQNLSAHDQSYLIGAVEILENRKKIDFESLMCGRLSFEEVERVKRVTRKFGVRLPDFMKNMQKYKEQLDKIAKANFID